MRVVLLLMVILCVSMLLKLRFGVVIVVLKVMVEPRERTLVNRLKNLDQLRFKGIKQKMHH